MRIGLLTYHHSGNLGAMMQTYATCRALRELGHDVQLVDIRQREGRHSGLEKVIVNVFYCKRDADLRRFRARYYPPLTRHYHSVDELRSDPPMVECLLVGSDQTWNPKISREMAMAYFLDFGGDRIKKLSFASSFGLGEWPLDSPLTEAVGKALRCFESISVREATGRTILRDTFGVNGTVVCDPTLLFDNYSEITGPIVESGELVCYKLERTKSFYSCIEEVKRMVGMPARLLNNSFPVRGLRYTYPPGVKEWITRLGGAGMVLTDSFHGVAFSLLYKRNFVAVLNGDGKDSRLVDLLDYLGLLGRVFDSMEALTQTRSWLEPIDYYAVESRLSAFRRTSWDYLSKALSL